MTIKDRKHWATKSEAARDEVRDFVEEFVDWLILRRREAAWASAGVLAAALVAGLLLYGRRSRVNAAWDKLSQAEFYASSDRATEARTLLSQVVEEKDARAASALASLLQGDLHYPRGEYDQALADYDKAAQDAPEALRPYALADKVMALEAAGKSADCAAAAQSFLDAAPDHLMAARVQVALARCQLAQGRSEAAKSTLQRLSARYPNTRWSEWANARLKTASR